MVIGHKIYSKVTPTKVDEILVNLKMKAEEAAKMAALTDEPGAD
jgi:hypothetical protein